MSWEWGADALSSSPGSLSSPARPPCTPAGVDAGAMFSVTLQEGWWWLLLEGSESQGRPVSWVTEPLCFACSRFGVLVVHIWILIGKLGPKPDVVLPQLPGETWSFLHNKGGLVQGSKESLLAEAGVTELPRRPAAPLTSWEETDISTEKKEVGHAPGDLSGGLTEPGSTPALARDVGDSPFARVSADLQLLSGSETFCRFTHLGPVGSYVLKDNQLSEQLRPCALKGS